MAISRIGSAAAAATSLTMPSGRALGDLELMFAFRNGSTSAPTIPSGWTLLKSVTTTSCWGGVYYRYCVDAADTSGTWTNATDLVCVVYRGVLGVGGFGTPSGAVSASISYPTLTMVQSAGNSWVVGFAGHRTASNLNSASVSGMSKVTSIGSGPQAAAWDTNGGVSSWAGASQTVNANSGHTSFTFELLADNSTWSPYDLSGIALSNSNKTGTSTSSPGNTNGVRSFIPRATGKYGFGWTNSSYGTDGFTNAVGIGTLAAPLTSIPGQPNNLGIAFWANAAGTQCNWRNHGATNNSSNYVAMAGGDSGYCVFDLDAGLAWIKYSSMSNWNNDGSANPDTGAGGFAYTDLIGLFVIPFFCTGNNASAFIINTNSISGAGLSNFKAWDDFSTGTTVALTGLSSTAAIGSFIDSASLTLTGVNASAAIGSLAATQGANVGLTGVSSAAAIGNFLTSASVSLSGVNATAVIGLMLPAAAAGR